MLDYLAADLSDNGFDLKRTLAMIATSRVYGSQTVEWDHSAPASEYVFAGPAAKRMTAEQFVDAFSEITGVAPQETAEDDVFVSADFLQPFHGKERPFIRSSLVSPRH